jgi:hypothetical protein
MIAYTLVVMLVGIYIAIVVFGHVLLIPEGRRNAFKHRSERYLDAYCCDVADQSKKHKNACER